jgi:hypothetical protein
MSIEKRIKYLEARAEKLDKVTRVPDRGYWAVRLYCKEVENHQRQPEGLPPIPLTPAEEEWKRESDIKFLQDGLPRMRASPGWQSPEAQGRLDEWEHDIREKYLEERR